jgi:ribosome-associated protein YbcJ (S4-like RNA binding protein)
MRLHKTILAFLLLSAISVNCNCQVTKLNITKVAVIEVIQVSSYTYLKVKTDGQENWLAVPTISAKKGETYFYKGGMEMPNFKSEELNRTFKSVLFLSKLFKNKSDLIAKNKVSNPSKVGRKQAKSANNKLNIKIIPPKGGLSIAELIKNKQLYQGKTIKIKGQVSKFKSQIMSRNWIHIQDGSEYDKIFDITVTSKANVKVGDTIMVRGTVVLDKDFGGGYFYKLIIENGTLFKTNKDNIAVEIESVHQKSGIKKEDSKHSDVKLSIKMEPVADGISIAELLKNKNLYKGKKVKLKGQVTKFSSQIMGKNWIHLQDGTSYANEYDLTLTSNAKVEIGDMVVFEGKVFLDKDFGMGYFYNLIIENAVLVK